MKKYLIIVCTLFSLQIFAQEIQTTTEDLPENKATSQTIETLKTAYITKELNLTTEEAQQFWPAYNAYVLEIKKARQDFKGDVIAFEEKKITILKKYKNDFKKVLNNDDRVKKCFNAEPEFHKLLRNEWKRRQDLHKQNGAKPFKPGGENGPRQKKSNEIRNKPMISNPHH